MTPSTSCDSDPVVEYDESDIPHYDVFDDPTIRPIMNPAPSGYVELNKAELHFAMYVGCMRRYLSIKDNRQQPDGWNAQDKWGVDIESTGAELAYCKWRGCYWPATYNTFKEPDVGHKTQIRWTHLLGGRLIIRPKDAIAEYYVLVVGSFWKYWVKGWISGKDARQSKYVFAPNGRPDAWFVPQRDLHKFDQHASKS